MRSFCGVDCNAGPWDRQFCCIKETLCLVYGHCYSYCVGSDGSILWINLHNGQLCVNVITVLALVFDLYYNMGINGPSVNSSWSSLVSLTLCYVFSNMAHVYFVMWYTLPKYAL